MAYKIDVAACTNCSSCVSACPVEAISEKDGKHVIDATICVDCGACSGSCGSNAISGE